MATIFDSSSVTPISTPNTTFFVSSATERIQDSGALAACFFLAFTLGAFSALLSKEFVIFEGLILTIYQNLKNHGKDNFSTI